MLQSTRNSEKKLKGKNIKQEKPKQKIVRGPIHSLNDEDQVLMVLFFGVF